MDPRHETGRQAPAQEPELSCWMLAVERSLALRAYRNQLHKLELQGPRRGLTGPASCLAWAYVTVAFLWIAVGTALIFVVIFAVQVDTANLEGGGRRVLGLVLLALASLTWLVGLIRGFQSYRADPEPYRLGSVRPRR